MEPGYIALSKSGELGRRVERLEERLASCDICPRECGVNRLAGTLGFCLSGRRLIVASICAHHGDEPVLSARGVSGPGCFGNLPPSGF